VVPKAGHKDALDGWLESELDGLDASVLTHRREVSRIQSKASQDMLSMVLLQGLIVIMAAAGLAVLNHVFTSQRRASSLPTSRRDCWIAPPACR
jgi:hypothetical protein